LGKRLIVQRRGRGSPTFRASTHKRLAPSRYVSVGDRSSVTGKVVDIVHEAGRGTPLGLIRLEDGEDFFTVVPEGIAVGQQISMGEAATPAVGNILPVKHIPEGTMICNIELSPGDGGKLVKSSGGYATVVSHRADGTAIKLPSGKEIVVENRCKAMIGVVAGSGRTEKPVLKAGASYFRMRAKGHKYPRVRGLAMISAYHPYGGGHKKRPGKPTTVSRTAPPGRKVGHIAARQSGRSRKRMRGTPQR
jgi:large subunit ribosomal protein L2